MMSDYISSVNIWLYTSNATTTIEFVGKINEINKMTDEIMSKYETIIFKQNDNFTTRDELQMTCLALNTSSRYLSIDSEELINLVNDTLVWLRNHQSEESSIYQNRLDQINYLSNEIYYNMNKNKILEPSDYSKNYDLSESESDDVDELVPEKPCEFSEKINSIISSLPDRITKKTIKKPKEDDILLEIDIDKLVCPKN